MRRLGRLRMISVVATQKTHAILMMSGFQLGETSSIPGCLCSSRSRNSLRINSFRPFVRTMRADVALPAKNRSA